MSFDITVTQERQHTWVVIKGQATVGQLLSLMQVLHVDSMDWPHEEVLIDLSGMERAFTPAERARLHEGARGALQRVRRIGFRWAG